MAVMVVCQRYLLQDYLQTTVVKHHVHQHHPTTEAKPHDSPHQHHNQHQFQATEARHHVPQHQLQFQAMLHKLHALKCHHSTRALKRSWEPEKFRSLPTHLTRAHTSFAPMSMCSSACHARQEHSLKQHWNTAFHSDTKHHFARSAHAKTKPIASLMNWTTSNACAELDSPADSVKSTLMNALWKETKCAQATVRDYSSIWNPFSIKLTLSVL